MERIFRLIIGKTLFILMGLVGGFSLIAIIIYFDIIKGSFTLSREGVYGISFAIFLISFTLILGRNISTNRFKSDRFQRFVSEFGKFIIISVLFGGVVVFFTFINPNANVIQILLALPVFPFYIFISMGFSTSNVFMQNTFITYAFIFGFPLVVLLWKTFFEAFLFPRINQNFSDFLQKRSISIESSDFRSGAKANWKKNGKFFIVLFLAVFFTRFIVLFKAYPGVDTGKYWACTEYLANGRWEIFDIWPAFESPTYFIATIPMAGFAQLFNRNIPLTFAIIMPCLSIIICYELMCITTRLTKNTKIGIFTGLFYTFSAAQIWMAYELYPQFFSTLFIISGIFILVTRQNNTRNKIISFSFFALALIYYFLLVMVIYYVYMYFVFFSKKEDFPDKFGIRLLRIKTLRRFLKVVILVGGFVGSVSLWYFISDYNHVTGIFTNIYYLFKDNVYNDYSQPTLEFTSSIFYFLSTLFIVSFGVIALFYLYQKFPSKVRVFIWILVLFSGSALFNITMASKNVYFRGYMYLDLFLIPLAAIGFNFCIQYMKQKGRLDSKIKAKSSSSNSVLASFVLCMVIASSYSGIYMRDSLFEPRETRAFIWIQNNIPELIHNNGQPELFFSRQTIKGWAEYFFGFSSVDPFLYAKPFMTDYSVFFVYMNPNVNWFYVLVNNAAITAIESLNINNFMLQCLSLNFSITSIYNVDSVIIYKIYFERLPLVAIHANVSQVFAGQWIKFTSNITSGNLPLQYSWDFGDTSQNDTTKDPVHSYTTQGDFTIQLTIIDADGDIMSSTQLIKVQ